MRRGALLASQRASEACRDPNEPTLRDLQLGMRVAVFETEPLDWLSTAGRLDRELAHLRQQQRPTITEETAAEKKQNIARTPVDRGTSQEEHAATELGRRMHRADAAWDTWQPSSGLLKVLKVEEPSSEGRALRPTLRAAPHAHTSTALTRRPSLRR